MESLIVIVPRTLLSWLFLAAALDGYSYLLRGRDIFDPPLSEGGKEFLNNLKRYHALWGAKATIDLIAALMLISNFHAPLAVLLIIPSSVIIIIFQLTINKVGIPVAAVLAVLLATLSVHYYKFYLPILSAEDGRGPLSSGAYGHPSGVAP